MHAVHGRKGSYDYPYVQRLDYDKFGQRTYVLHGNNTVSRYSYDPYNRRLSHLTVGKGDGNPFMDLSYGYDEVGNITDLANRATNNSPSQMGGATSYSYTYDDLYRLTDSSGTFDTPPGKQHRFTLSMGYDTIHNITRKTQVDVLRQPSGQEVTQKKTTYDWTYRYDGNQPHAPTHLGDRTFTYDANGNQLRWNHDQNGTRRTITWDDENRIREIKDNGHRLTYTYDASGQRLTKRGPQGETGYINQWFTLRNGEVGTKHVYAGTTRVVSKLVKKDKPNSKRKGRIVYEKDQYTYHPDHLGTSAYITHTNGQVYQHLEYFPFGETWVEEHSNKQRTPYLFTAKELDEASQLYYFGARYYDPRTSVWQSADPILGEYLDGENGMGGISNPRNLNLFGYGHFNPVKFLDPDGQEVYAISTGGELVIDPSGCFTCAKPGLRGSLATGVAFDSETFEITLFKQSETGVGKSDSVVSGGLFMNVMFGGEGSTMGDLEGESLIFSGSYGFKNNIGLNASISDPGADGEGPEFTEFGISPWTSRGPTIGVSVGKTDILGRSSIISDARDDVNQKIADSVGEWLGDRTILDFLPSPSGD